MAAGLFPFSFPFRISGLQVVLLIFSMRTDYAMQPCQFFHFHYKQQRLII